MSEKQVMKGIYAIKAGDLDTGSRCLSDVAQELRSKGAEVIIAGCTEIPLVLHSSQDLRVIDPTEILAEAVVLVACSGVTKTKETPKKAQGF